MDIKKLKLFQTDKRLSVVFLLCIVTACGQTNKVRYERNEEGVELSSNYEYGDELPCKPDTVSYPVRNSRLFEDILDVYIDNEKLSAKDDFIAVSSGCWTDSTYIVIMEHYKWNDSADSLIYLERGQASSYRGIDIYLGVSETTHFPIPTRLVISDKKVTRRVLEPFSPYNEYFNDVHVEYSPKENRILNVLGTSNIAMLYRRLFWKNGLLK